MPVPPPHEPVPFYSWTDLTYLLAHHVPAVSWRYYVGNGTIAQCPWNHQPTCSPQPQPITGTPEICSYVSDNNYLVSFSVSGTLRWRTPNPTHVPLISFNVTNDGHLVGQGASGWVLAVDPASGLLTGSLLLTDTIAGVSGTFISANTVSVAGNRLYTVTQFCASTGCPDPQTTFEQGRLYAIDVVQGVPRIAWHWDFAWPTGTPCLANGPGQPVMFVGTENYHAQSASTFVILLNLTTGTLLWQIALGAGPDQLFPGLYPVAQTAAGMVAVTERTDGLMYGLQLLSGHTAAISESKGDSGNR